MISGSFFCAHHCGLLVLCMNVWHAVYLLATRVSALFVSLTPARTECSVDCHLFLCTFSFPHTPFHSQVYILHACSLKSEILSINCNPFCNPLQSFLQSCLQSFLHFASINRSQVHSVQACSPPPHYTTYLVSLHSIYYLVCTAYTTLFLCTASVPMRGGRATSCIASLFHVLPSI
jgi:hypothetical protein